MISDLDIWRSANVLVTHYGEDAPLEAEMRAERLLEEGDSEGYAVWKRVLRAVDDLLKQAPGERDAKH